MPIVFSQTRRNQKVHTVKNVVYLINFILFYSARYIDWKLYFTYLLGEAGSSISTLPVFLLRQLILQAYGNRVSCTTVKRAPSRERDPETSRQSEGWAIPRKWAEFAGRSRCIDTFIYRNQKVDALWTTEWACRYLIWIPLCAQYDASISLYKYPYIVYSLRTSRLGSHSHSALRHLPDIH